MNTDQLLTKYRSADGEISCYNITPKLNSGQNLSDSQAAFVDKLDELLGSSPPLEQDVVVYRGCALEELDSARIYPSFISTSADLKEAMRFCRGCIAKIIVPSGMRILKVSPDVANVSTLEQQEYLVPRNLILHLEEWIMTEEESLIVSFLSPPDQVTVRLVSPTMNQDAEQAASSNR